MLCRQGQAQNLEKPGQTGSSLYGVVEGLVGTNENLRIELNPLSYNVETVTTLCQAGRQSNPKIERFLLLKVLLGVEVPLFLGGSFCGEEHWKLWAGVNLRPTHQQPEMNVSYVGSITGHTAKRPTRGRGEGCPTQIVPQLKCPKSCLKLSGKRECEMFRQSGGMLASRNVYHFMLKKAEGMKAPRSPESGPRKGGRMVSGLKSMHEDTAREIQMLTEVLLGCRGSCPCNG